MQRTVTLPSQRHLPLPLSPGRFSAATPPPTTYYDEHCVCCTLHVLCGHTHHFPLPNTYRADMPGPNAVAVVRYARSPPPPHTADLGSWGRTLGYRVRLPVNATGSHVYLPPCRWFWLFLYTFQPPFCGVTIFCGGACRFRITHYLIPLRDVPRIVTLTPTHCLPHHTRTWRRRCVCPSRR